MHPVHSHLRVGFPQMNRPPQPPDFVIDEAHGRCLELAADGSYKSCLQFHSTLETHFNAEYSKHLEAGPRPHSDKDKGHWNVTMFGQGFTVMRDRGYGICIWGAQPPADLRGLLRIAAHFGAVEFMTWQKKLLCALRRISAQITTTMAK